MRNNKVLPDEIAEIIRKIGVDLSRGIEGEGGLVFLSRIESALEEQGLTAEAFDVHYPNITDDLKREVALIFLYDIALKNLAKMGVKLEMPRGYEITTDGLKTMPMEEHLENLAKIWRLSEAPYNSTRLFSEYKELKDQLEQLWERTPAEIRNFLFGDNTVFNLNKDEALRWLTTPHLDLNGKSPAEAIADGKAEKVKKMIDDYQTGLPL